MDQSRYAARDPEVEAAMEALGVGRRDFIAAYDDPRSSGITAREERAQRLQARDEADARRASREAAAASGDQTASRLNAWHSMPFHPTHYLLRAVLTTHRCVQHCG